MNDQQALCTVQLLLRNGTRKRDRIAGAFQSFANQRLIFTASQPFPVSGAVSLEYNDILFVGEILACQAEAKNTWKVLLQVQQMLHGLESLLMLRQQLQSMEPASPGLSQYGKPAESATESLLPLLTCAS